MVSLRRRRLLGLCSGRSCFLAPVVKSSDGVATNDTNQNSKAVAVHPLPLQDNKQQDEIPNTNSHSSDLHRCLTEEQMKHGRCDFSNDRKPVVGRGSESSNGSGSSPLIESRDQPFPEPAVKRRKPHRRKHHQNQEPCLMRGVYFKNMKWQAAIKVDKKQIHLGTVGSQVEAAHLYDRAAFMCGREPNLEIAEEEKRELRKLNWDEFLAMTRHTITNKKQRRRVGVGSEKKFEIVTENGDWDSDDGGNNLSTSDEAEPDG